MSTTQIPPANPAPSEQPSTRPLAGDLYDAQHWELAYTGRYGAPALLVQLQDDLTHSRKREAFWISVVVHLVFVLLIVNSQRIGGWVPRRNVIVMNPNDKDKNLTYLELPADEQKVTKRPDTKIISDKDRIASSRAPQVNRDELKKILDAGRTGRPGPTAPPVQQPAPAPQQVQPAQPQPQAAPPPKPQDQQMVAKLQAPPVETPKPSFNTSPMSAGSAIEQAARAAAANRGGYGGDSGDAGTYGQAPGRRATAAMGPLDVLSDTMGVDFGPYLQRVVHDVRLNWYNLIPESARAPLMKKGKGPLSLPS